MNQPILHPKADEEMNAEAAYYNRKAKGLGDEFLDEVQLTFGRILAHPEGGSPEEPPLRRRRLRRFPHSVIYGPSPAGIFIVAIAHPKRRPGYWRDRI